MTRTLRRSEGFTLLEVLISITILSILTVLVFLALRIGARAWEKGEKRIEAVYRERIVLNLIQEQLASMATKKLALLDKERLYLVGNQERLEFLSTRQLMPNARQTAVKVSYRIRTDASSGFMTLSIREKQIFVPETEKKDKDENDAKGYVDILSGMGHIAFDYLGVNPKDGGYSWVTDWSGDLDNGFPKAVRLRIYKSEFDYSTIIAPIHVGDLEEE